MRPEPGQKICDPHPDVLAQDIAEGLGAALALFKSTSEDLETEALFS